MGLAKEQKNEDRIAPPAVHVSVVIPTHNRPELVANAVASALRQDFARLEVIVVIDGEDQPTREALNTFCDGRLHIIDLAINVGGAEARNIGVRAARGEWIAFLDDDDEWLPYKLSRQMDAAHSKASWPVISSRMIVQTTAHECIRPLRAYHPAKSLSDFLFCRKSLWDGPFAMQTSTLMMPKELMLVLPFRSGLKRHHDWDWLLRAEQTPGVQFTVINEPLTIYRTGDGRDSLGRSQDWEFSLTWGKEMRGHFSAKAYSWFLATECATRAVKSHAGARAYVEILGRFLLDGHPSVESAVMMAFFLLLPKNWRNLIHSAARRRRQKRQITSYASVEAHSKHDRIGVENAGE